MTILDGRRDDVPALKDILHIRKIVGVISMLLGVVYLKPSKTVV